MVFPKRFLWGVSSSGFQFEMGDSTGANVDPNTDWYVWTHDVANIKAGVVSGDFPEKGVNYLVLYKNDHKIAEALGLNAFRIGIEWSRIFPKSTSTIHVDVEKAPDGNIADIHVNDSTLKRLEEVADNKAVDKYRAIIMDLRTRNLKVIVCLNHFTLPLWIHDPIVVRNTRLRKGPKGWFDGQTILEFTKYAAYVAWKLGDIVDEWATFNEPTIISETGYLMPQSGFPPGLRSYSASKKVVLNMIIAHARAYDVIKKVDVIKADEDSSSPSNVGVIHNVIPMQPLSTEKEIDVNAAKLMDYMHNHRFIEPLCSGRLSEKPRDLDDTAEEKSYLKQRLDWLGVNYYSRMVVQGRKSFLARLFAGMPVIPDIVMNYGFTCQPNGVSADGRPTSDGGWEIYPEGMLEALKMMAKYGRPLYVTENGIADAEDVFRANFIVDHLKVMQKALNEEKIDVRGYFHWALTDNYEWAKGFSMKFGLCAVDLNTKKRKQRPSAKIYKEIIEREKLN